MLWYSKGRLMATVFAVLVICSQKSHCGLHLWNYFCHSAFRGYSWATWSIKDVCWQTLQAKQPYINLVIQSELLNQLNLKNTKVISHASRAKSLSFRRQISCCGWYRSSFQDYFVATLTICVIRVRLIHSGKIICSWILLVLGPVTTNSTMPYKSSIETTHCILGCFTGPALYHQIVWNNSVWIDLVLKNWQYPHEARSCWYESSSCQGECTGTISKKSRCWSKMYVSLSKLNITGEFWRLYMSCSSILVQLFPNLFAAVHYQEAAFFTLALQESELTSTKLLYICLQAQQWS